MTPPAEQWHMDKKVPIGIIAGIVIQTVCLVWYASKLDSRVGTLEVANAAAIVWNARQDDNIHSIDTRLARIEERQNASLEILKRLERFVETVPRP